MTSNPHIRLITEVAENFLVVSLKFRSRAAPLAAPAVTTQDFVPPGGCTFRRQPQSRLVRAGFTMRPTQSHASQPQTHAVCSPRAELESLVHHPIFRPLHYHFVENRILVGFVS